MRRVAFLVKNGIGFGHIRRALLVAEAVKARGELDPIIISQARSLDLYRNTSVDVVNFPLLHRVASAAAEDAYVAILDQLLERLDPAVVVEDTYPEPRYLSLPALAGRPRLLLMRRLDGPSFDHLREQGRFAAYDRIMIAQYMDDFDREGHSPDSLAAVHYSGRFSFVGNVAYVAAPEQVEAVRREYSASGEPIVVVNAGAGGDQTADGYGDRLFGTCAQIADRLSREGAAARFVLVTGPYYAGRPLASTNNTVVRSFEPRLPALLAAAHVAVIKPGNNALSEALAGGAHLILVPDVSFMEGVEAHAARTVERFGGVIVSPEVDQLDPAIRKALGEPPRTRRRAADPRALHAVVDLIHRYADDPVPSVPARGVLLALRLPMSVDPAAIPPVLRKTVLCAENEDLLTVDDAPPDASPQALVDVGVRVLLCRSEVSPAVRRWLSHHPPSPSLPVLPACVIYVHKKKADRIERQLAHHLRRGDTNAAILDLTSLDEAELSGHLSRLCAWLSRQPIALLTPSDVAAWHGRQLLEAQ